MAEQRKFVEVPYRVISDCNMRRFEIEVMDKIIEGWQLAGGISVICTTGNERIYHQAVYMPSSTAVQGEPS